MKELNGKIWRPLLKFSRAEVLEYLSEKQLSHVEDSTNNESVYTRNIFRNQIIPSMEQYFPALKTSLLRTIGNLKSTEYYLLHHLEKDKRHLLEKIGENHYKIDIEKLKKYGEALPYLIYELFSPFGFSPSAVEDLVRTLAEESSGKTFHSKEKKYTLVKNSESVELFPTLAKEELGDVIFRIDSISDIDKLPIPITCEKKKRDEVTFSKEKHLCYVDPSKLQFPLTLRHWREGDRFAPLGMSGKMKKVSDYFIDLKIRTYEKQSVWILTSGSGQCEQIIWLVGMRADERFKVDETSEEVLVLQLNQ